MSSNGSFSMLENVFTKRQIKQCIYFINELGSYNLKLPLDIQLKLFDSTILPIITYRSDVWGYENLVMFEHI